MPAIEALYYLNEEYERGLAECYRVMHPQARFLLADRSYEGALLTRLLYYGGVEATLETAHRNEMWDGENHQRVRSRFFLREELGGLLAAQGFEILKWRGISAFSLLLSFREDSRWRILARKAFEALLRRVAMPKGSKFATGGFLLMDRKVVECVRQMREANRLIFGLLAWTGFRQAVVEYDRRRRVAGRSTWSAGRMIKSMYDGLLGFSATIQSRHAARRLLCPGRIYRRTVFSF